MTRPHVNPVLVGTEIMGAEATGGLTATDIFPLIPISCGVRDALIKEMMVDEHFSVHDWSK